jgi:hypothetical protein
MWLGTASNILCQTKERAQADDSLLLIGSVQELRVDHPHPGRPDRVEVVIPTPQLKNGSREHDPEPVMRQGKVDASANDLKGHNPLPCCWGG